MRPFPRLNQPIAGSPWASKAVLVLSLVLIMRFGLGELSGSGSSMWSRPKGVLVGLGLLSSVGKQGGAAAGSPVAGAGVAAAPDAKWYPPPQTRVNNLTEAVNGQGTYGFIFNSSTTPEGSYGTYNWCNMPHVRGQEYVRPDEKEWELQFVEVIHRHHKRTPYFANSFPVEPYRWDCDDAGVFHYGQPLGPLPSSGAIATPAAAAAAYWQGYVSPVNPFAPRGWTGTCQFPQITADGLRDSWQHGADLYAVYAELLAFLPKKGEKKAVDGPEEWRSSVRYRVTQNVITSQVAGMVVAGMWGAGGEAVPLVVEASGIDSLEPAYPCPAASSAFDSLRSTTSPSSPWASHLALAAPLFATLDRVSAVHPPPDDGGFHASLDHYYDNLSARQCHGKPLPCAGGGPCVAQAEADQAYRLGQWEYAFLYRAAGPQTLSASAAGLGVWIAELAAHLRAKAGMEDDGGGGSGGVGGEAMQGGVKYYHNVAHDGSLARLLAVLQIDDMVWPGMGAEVVFELWRRKGAGSKEKPGRYFVRVLFGGRVLKSSHPALGNIDMLPLDTLLAYFDALVGARAALVRGKCDGSLPL